MKRELEGDSGGEFTGIDPAAMNQMIKDLDNAKKGVEENIPGLKDRFSTAELDTGDITKLNSVASWVGGELGMLRRRQSMAAQTAANRQVWGFGEGMVEGEWPGHFDSPEAARERAKELADEVDDRGELSQEHWDELARYQMDPDFAAAFVEELGPEKVAMLQQYTQAFSHEDGEEGEQAADNLAVLGNLMATASHHVTIDKDWLEAYGAYSGNTPAAIARLMEYGTWDKDALKQIAKDLGSPNFGPDPLQDEVLAALARNPQAAAEFYNENREAFLQIAHAEPSGLRNTEGFAEFVRAATVEARDVYARIRINDPSQENLAEENARFLIENVGDAPGHADPVMQRVYGDVVKEYWDDLVYSVNAPVDITGEMSSRPGIEVPTDAWKAFMKEAMRDGETAGKLLGQMEVWLQGARQDGVGQAERWPDGSNATFWDDQELGRMRAFFKATYSEVYNEMVDENDEYDQAVEAGIDKAVDWVTDPRGIATDILKEGAKFTLKEIYRAVDDDEIRRLDLSVLDSKHAWENYAREKYNQGAIDPLTETDGTTWEGDPSFYEDLYGGDFTDNGQVLSAEELQERYKDEPEKYQAAIRAYNEWLEDPAVVAATQEQYRNEGFGFSSESGD